MVVFTQLQSGCRLVLLPMENEQRRRRVIAAAAEWTNSAGLAPTGYEQWLLEEYAGGRMTLDRVVAVLESLPKAGVGGLASSRNWSR
jgi:hypothetical protein